MLKTFWQKIKQNHLLAMVLCCLVPIVLIIGFLAFFKGSDYWIWLVILLCPLIHIFMMKGHKHGDHDQNMKKTIKNKIYKCPECGFQYEEKEWAQKCEAWCKEHKTCNVEIIKHARQ